MTALQDLSRSELGEVAALHAVNHVEDHDDLVALLGDDGSLILDSDHRSMYGAAVELGRTAPETWARSWGAPSKAIAARLGDSRRWGWRLIRLGAGLDEHVGEGIEAARLLIEKTRAQKLRIQLAHQMHDLSEGVDVDAVQRRLEELSQLADTDNAHSGSLDAPESAPGAEDRRRHAEERLAMPPPPVPRRPGSIEGAA